MSGDFVDSTVLIYVLSADVAKAARAEALIGEGGAISVQVRSAEEGPGFYPGYAC